MGIPYSNLSVHAVSESEMSADGSSTKRHSEKDDDEEQTESDNIPSSLVRPLNGISMDISKQDRWKTADVASALIATNGAHPAGKSKKTILTPGGFSDAIISATYIAETNLPNEFGHYRIRAYRIEEFDDVTREPNPLGAGAGLGSEPCVIYCTDKPPFGGEKGGAKDVPVRIHDQCFTSEVFGSRR